MTAAPRHVLMTADAVGGVWTYALDLAEGLAEIGVRVTLAILGPKPEADQIKAARAVPGLRIVATGLPLDWTAEAPEPVRRAGAAVAGLAKALGADLVHLNSPALAADGPFAVPVVGVCHSCVATWWEAAGKGAMPDHFRWRTELTAQGYLHCDALVAPSAAHAAAVRRIYGERPRVVRNGRRSPPAGRGTRRRAAIFTAGRLWDPGKNLATLDAAAARLSVPVWAAGPVAGPEGSRIALRNMRLLGRLDAEAMAAQMAQAAVFASLALYEPFGLAVLEAAQAGCALVLSDIPTFRELWDGAAEFVPPTDEAAAAAVLSGVLGDPERRQRMGRAARERAGQYGIAAMAAGMLDVYGSVARGVAPGEAA